MAMNQKDPIKQKYTDEANVQQHYEAKLPGYSLLAAGPELEVMV